MSVSEALDGYLKKLDGARPRQLVGRVREVTGLLVRATVSGARLGEIVRIRGEARTLPAEVVGVRDEQVTLLPLGAVDGIGPDAEVVAEGEVLAVPVGPALIGRVLGGLGQPIDGDPELGPEAPLWPVRQAAPPPLSRRRIHDRLPLGVRAIDGLMTVGEGQRVGIFAAAGAGKTSLLGQIARQAPADVVVIGLVGERGREVREFLEDALGPEGRRRSVVVAATADAPAVVRARAAHVATAVAEYFRESGQRVLLLIDSLTRFARAQRDAGLAVGELPARRGYPASVFAELPRLVERAGNSANGVMTAIYTVLVGDDDPREPISEEARSLLDGHIVLDRALAERGHWPAIDVSRSLSRVMAKLVTPEHAAAAAEFRRVLSIYESKRSLISLGAYQYGSDPEVDEAIDRIDALEGFLRQSLDESSSFAETVADLLALACR